MERRQRTHSVDENCVMSRIGRSCSVCENSHQRTLRKGPPALCPNVSNMTIIPTVIVMVGLPARGKTYMAKKLCRYLNWIGIKSKVFNVGEYRRGCVEKYTSHDFFNPENKEFMELRNKYAMQCLEDMCKWLDHCEKVAVFDATNTTRERRKMIHDTCINKYCYKVFFVESVCADPEIIHSNIKEVKVASPDYKGYNTEDAVSDFMQRIRHYEDAYKQLDETYDKHYSFIKIFNEGEKFLVNRVQGHVQSRVVYYLMNIHVLPRTIYIVRHGESELNLQGRIGGDSNLSENGRMFGKELAKFVARKKKKVPTATLR